MTNPGVSLWLFYHSHFLQQTSAFCTALCSAEVGCAAEGAGVWKVLVNILMV